jgi:hypothetical protein
MFPYHYSLDNFSGACQPLCKRKQTKGTCVKTNIIFMMASRSEIECFIYDSKWFPLPAARIPYIHKLP